MRPPLDSAIPARTPTVVPSITSFILIAPSALCVTDDWAVLDARAKVSGSGAVLNLGIGFAAPGLQYWPGKFTGVEFYQMTFTGPLLGTNDAKNIFSIHNCGASVLSNGYYGGSGNGCNGEVKVAALNSNGDLYVGGEFTAAGGFPYSEYIGFFGYEYGWNTTYIFSAFYVVTGLTWNDTTKVLRVVGNDGVHTLSQVQFGSTATSVSNNDADFHTSSGNFGMSCWWTD